METELINDFDFRRKAAEKEIEKKPKISIGMLKNLKYASFLMIGGLSIGVGVGLTNNLMQGYIVDKGHQNKIEDMQAQNEEVRKNKKFEIALQAKKIEDQINAANVKAKRALDEKIALDEKKDEYNIWLKNKEDMIKNYESQLGMYDKAYGEAVKGVKDGIISIDDLAEIRNVYQQYKKTINGWIDNVQYGTKSFEVYSNLNEEWQTALKKQLTDYQAGSLNRSKELENALIDKVGKYSAVNQKDKNKFQLSVQAKNNMIDDLADVMNNNNDITVVKKLKR